MGRTFGRYGMNKQSPRERYMSSVAFEVLGPKSREGDTLTTEDRVDALLSGARHDDYEVAQ